MVKAKEINITFETEPAVGLFIIAKNSKESLEKCIESIKKEFKIGNKRIYVGFKKSCDKDLQKSVKKAFKNDKIVSFISGLPEKDAKCYNNMVKEAKKDGVSVIGFIGDNVEFKNDVCSLLSYVMINNNTDAGSCGCCVLNGNADDLIHNMGYYVTNEGGFGRICGGSKYEDSIFGDKNLFIVDGICENALFITRYLFESVQGFNEDSDDLFIGVEIGVRLKNIGKKNYMATDALCVITENEKKE